MATVVVGVDGAVVDRLVEQAQRGDREAETRLSIDRLWIVDVVAMHDGRPYILRFWTGNDKTGMRGVDEAIAGFRFTD